MQQQKENQEIIYIYDEEPKMPELMTEDLSDLYEPSEIKVVEESKAEIVGVTEDLSKLNTPLKIDKPHQIIEVKKERIINNDGSNWMMFILGMVCTVLISSLAFFIYIFK